MAYPGRGSLQLGVAGRLLWSPCSGSFTEPGGDRQSEPSISVPTFSSQTTIYSQERGKGPGVKHYLLLHSGSLFSFHTPDKPGQSSHR